MFASGAAARTALEHCGPSEVVPLTGEEPPAKLILALP
jgi:hypothetical protein